MSASGRSVEALLTAELDELAGEADTELGRLVRDCPHYSAAARKILAANVALNASLAERGVLRSDSLITRARSKEATAVEGRSWWRARVPAAPPAWRWVPVAAAVGTLSIAAILLALVDSDEPLPGPEWNPDATAPEYAAQPLLVDAPGYNVAVIPTANPDITIFWFSKENDDAQEVDPVRDGPIAIGALTACDLGPNLEVRTFQVETTDAAQLQSVGVLIQPYVYKDRPNAPGSMSVSTAANAITVRETPDNLDRIERVLAELTFPPTPNPSFRLHFQFVEANGATEPDPAIADVVEELRRTFRFTGYSLTGEAVIAATPNEKFAHELQTQTDGRSYSITGDLADPGHTLRVRFAQKRPIGPRTFTDGTVLSTTVGIRPGQTLVLGSVPVEGAGTLLVIARMIEAQG